MGNTPLGNYLRMLRKEKGLKQEDLADMLGIIRGAYSHYENGRTKPTLEGLRILADYYEVPLEKLARLAGIHFEDADFDLAGQTSKAQVNDKLNESGKMYLQFLKDCSNMSKDELSHWITAEDKELVYYCHKLSDRDKQILINMAKIMAQ